MSNPPSPYNMQGSPLGSMAGPSTLMSNSPPFRYSQMHLIPGLNHPLTVTTFVTAAQYNALPTLAQQPPVPSSLLCRFGEIVATYNLQHIFGAHLIYNRFPPGISEGSFVTTTRTLLNAGARAANTAGGEPDMSSSNIPGPALAFTSPGIPPPTLKKMIWQSGIWELALDGSNSQTGYADLNMVHGRLYMLSNSLPSRDYPMPQSYFNRSRQHSMSMASATGPSQHLQLLSQNSSQLLPMHLQMQMQMQMMQQALPEPKPTCLGNTHFFLAYEYEYGPLSPVIATVPDAFWEDIADFILGNGLENHLGLEVLDGPDPTTGRAGPGRFVVEEYDPSRSRKASVVEVPVGKQLSWTFSKNTSNAQAVYGGQLPEIDVDVNLVRVGGTV